MTLHNKGIQDKENNNRALEDPILSHFSLLWQHAPKYINFCSFFDFKRWLSCVWELVVQTHDQKEAVHFVRLQDPLTLDQHVQTESNFVIP